MKALSIRQPWAHAILHLGKRVENRDWAGCSYRGPVLLHASKTLVIHEFEEAARQIAAIAPGSLASFMVPSGGHGRATWRPAPTLSLGGIVGRARIVGTLECPGVYVDMPGAGPWYGGGFALVLADVEPLPFIPWKGALGFFDVPDELVAAALKRAAQPVSLYHAHLDRCPRCSTRPFDLCPMGAALLAREATC